jgi:hypothetical protein
LINSLREIGFSLPELQALRKNNSPDWALKFFNRCSTQLHEQITQLQARLNMIQSYVSLIEESQALQPGEIELRHYAEQRIHCSSLARHKPGGKRKDCERLRQAHAQIRKNGNAGCPMGFAYLDFCDLLEHPEYPAMLVSFDPDGPDIRPAGEYLIGTEHCCYEKHTGLTRRMFDYALRNGLEFCGPAYTVYLLDAASVKDAEQYLLQIAVQVKKIK